MQKKQPLHPQIYCKTNTCWFRKARKTITSLSLNNMKTGQCPYKDLACTIYFSACIDFQKTSATNSFPLAFRCTLSTVKIPFSALLGLLTKL